MFQRVDDDGNSELNKVMEQFVVVVCVVVVVAVVVFGVVAGVAVVAVVVAAVVFVRTTKAKNNRSNEKKHLQLQPDVALESTATTRSKRALLSEIFK